MNTTTTKTYFFNAGAGLAGIQRNRSNIQEMQAWLPYTVKSAGICNALLERECHRLW